MNSYSMYTNTGIPYILLDCESGLRLSAIGSNPTEKLDPDPILQETGSESAQQVN